MGKKIFWICFLIWGVICFGFVCAGYYEKGIGGACLGVFVSGLLAIPVFSIAFTSKLDQERWDMLYWQDYEELKAKYGPILKKIWVNVRSSQGSSLWWSGSGKQELNICKEVLFINDAEGGCFCIHYSQHPIHKKEEFFRNVLVVENIMVPEAVLNKIYATIYINKKRNATLFLNINSKEDLDFIMSVAQQARQNKPRDVY